MDRCPPRQSRGVSRAIILIFALCASIASAAVLVSPAAGSAQGLLVLDPGHGGQDDPGGQVGGSRESMVVLDLALALEKSLKEQGWQVLVTRRTDQALSITARVALANQSGALAYVSLHVNHSFNASVGGPRVFVAPESLASGNTEAPRWEEAASARLPESKRLAQALAIALGIKGAKPYQSLRLAQFRGLVVPGVLIEVDHASQTGRAAQILGAAWAPDLVRRLVTGLNAWSGAAKP